MVKSISSVATLTAIEKGYFKAFGIKVETQDLDTSANVIALLAQNQLQVVEGGISAAYFNAIEKNLPATIAIDRVSSGTGMAPAASWPPVIATAELYRIL